MTTTDMLGAADAAARPDRFRFTAWRWHFYAGLYVVPFLVILAVTGLVMLWTSALTGLDGEHAAVPVSGPAMAVSALQAAAESAVPGGAASKYIAPEAPGRVAVFRVDGNDGALTVLVDPYSAAVVDSFPWRAGLYDLAHDIHGTLLIGTVGDRMIELAASLGIILVVTGIYLHWPRGGRGAGDLLVPRLAARGRAFWKSLHGVVGFWMSAVMILFLLSGLSWSGIWGERMVQAWSTFPAAKWDAVPLSDDTHAKMNHAGTHEVPWGLEQTPMPASGSLTGTAAVAAPPTIDGVAAFAATLDLPGRFQVNLPTGDDGVWTVSHDSMSNDGPDPTADRTIHIDRYTGNVLADVPYADYSAYARMMAWGIALHEGDMGWWNVALNTLFCAAMVFLPLSGVVMWWKRRPAHAARLGAPPRAQGGAWAALRSPLTLIVVALAGAFPLAGAAIMVVILADWLVIRRIPVLDRALT